MKIDIDHLVALLDEKSLTHLEYEPGDGSRIVIKREVNEVAVPVRRGDDQSPVQVATASQPTAAPNPASASTGTTVTAPLVGVVYLRKEPDAPKFVELNAHVKAGDVLCLIEAMKMFSEITAPVTGVITSIDIADGDLAEFGAPLFTIEQQS